MTSALEIAANLTVAASILLAGRNSVHTWWTGIIGCSLFALVFYEARLYADVVLQGVFVLTSVIGWWQWLRGDHGHALPISRVQLRTLGWMLPAAVLASVGYGLLLHTYRRLRAVPGFGGAGAERGGAAVDDAPQAGFVVVLAAGQQHRHSAVRQPRAAPHRGAVCRVLDQRAGLAAALAAVDARAGRRHRSGRCRAWVSVSPPGWWWASSARCTVVTRP
jgi:hypothetical protein